MSSSIEMLRRRIKTKRVEPCLVDSRELNDPEWSVDQCHQFWHRGLFSCRNNLNPRKLCRSQESLVVSSYTLGGFIHILLVLALVTFPLLLRQTHQVRQSLLLFRSNSAFGWKAPRSAIRSSGPSSPTLMQRLRASQTRSRYPVISLHACCAYSHV
jgi:hypothetical protein